MPRTRQQTGVVATRSYTEAGDEVDTSDNEQVQAASRGQKKAKARRARAGDGGDDDNHEGGMEQVEEDDADAGFKLWTTTSKVTFGKDLETASQVRARLSALSTVTLLMSICSGMPKRPSSRRWWRCITTRCSR
jgi:hypothetical protein